MELKPTLQSAGAKLAEKLPERSEMFKAIGENLVKFCGDAKNFTKGVFQYGFFNKEAAKALDIKTFMKAGNGHVALIVGAGAAAAGVFAFASSLRTAKEAIDSLQLRGNHFGSIWYSGAQALLHASTLASIAGLGIFAPTAIMACPLLPILPSALALGMDYFQDFCTNPNNMINKMGQKGLSNRLLDMKRNDGSIATYLPKMIHFWDAKVRKNDEKVAAWFGMDLNRPDLGLTHQGVKPGWMV